MSVLPSIILVGSGGHAESCVDIIEQEGRYTIMGLIGLRDEIGKTCVGYPIIGIDEDLPQLVKETSNFLISIGHIRTSTPRINLFNKLEKMGAIFPTIISPKAYISRHACIGKGNIVMHGAIINAGAKIGNNCIINSLALVEHGAFIGDHCHISTTAVINGCVKVGRGTFIGSGSKIRQCLSIGKNCLIGMGQNVIKDCPDNTQIPERKGAK